MAENELILDGKTYTASKKAAQTSQYAQDYIGQLCRAGRADCRRINGLWYVTMESLEKNKATASEVRAKAFAQANAMVPKPQYEQKTETILAFSGEEFVSSKEASDITGYNPDYVAQLARGGKIRARQIGSRWYVSKKDLLENKEKNDALLAQVQVSSSGISGEIAEKSTVIIEKSDEPDVKLFKHYNESHLPLIPSIPEKPAEPAIESPYSTVTQVPVKNVQNDDRLREDSRYEAPALQKMSKMPRGAQISSVPRRGFKKSNLASYTIGLFFVLTISSGSLHVYFHTGSGGAGLARFSWIVTDYLHYDRGTP